jgi:hypothetical protein
MIRWTTNIGLEEGRLRRRHDGERVQSRNQTMIVGVYQLQRQRASHARCSRMIGSKLASIGYLPN